MASCDDLETNTEFARKNGAQFPILSDADKQVAAAYDVLGAAGYPSRWTFYIGPDGTVLDIDRKVNPLTAGADIVERLKQLAPSASD